MGLKMAILILAMFAMLLLASSEVKSTNAKEVTNGVGEAKYPGGGYGGGYPGNGGGYPGHGGDGHGGGYPARDVGCRFGCCRFFNGRCIRCCSYAGEAVVAQTQDETHN
ncbi:glycine-rich cell wall structural protein-like [Vigna radiata var. radiata]|uniref:Glycine-rich cell wall structural protein-like n=1 Tax=Vigna radiata var. radiata TaxID=3916 RepID=A0A3Q0F005_VIGRR|nr:glycine-rich cell wall structural protein-like [Vigna radiata var. radiata]